MDDQENLLPWLVIHRLQHFSQLQLHQLLEHFGTPHAFLSAGMNELSMLGIEQREEIMALQQAQTHPLVEQAQLDIQQLNKHQVQVITYHSGDYPIALKQIHRPPLLLYVKGDASLLLKPQIAVVGARKSSASARDLTFAWCAELAQHGLVITSGMALGIDGAAHAGAIKAGGKTLAILAHGLDQVYPEQHRELSQAIIENGALVSEFPLFTAPRRDHFPRRNRIISGLSSGVLVVEAAIKSGSLITARYALEQSRDVFAVPGSINNMMAKGCHQLIKDGAYLVESAEDILQAMSWQQIKQQTLFEAMEQKPADVTTQELLRLIPFDSVHLDELMMHYGKSIAEITSELMLLEINGHIESVAGNYRRIR